MRSIAPDPFNVRRMIEAGKASHRQHCAGAKFQVSTSRFKAAAESVTDAEHAQISFPGKCWPRNITLTQTLTTQEAPSAQQRGAALQLDVAQIVNLVAKTHNNIP